jgi:hypothetical protein
MGDIADMMIEGDLCAECGCALDCEGFGIPILCHDCHKSYNKRCGEPVNGMLCERFYKEGK